MRLLETSLRGRQDVVRLSATVELSPGQAPTELFFEFADRHRSFLASDAEPFAAALLLPAMHAGQPLEIGVPVSPELLFNLGRIRDVFHAWYPELQAVDVVTSAPPARSTAPADRAAAFFSGGVDSFFTVLKHHVGERTLPAPLTHVIFMRGIETRLEQARDVEHSARRAEEIAQALGMECVIGQTNLRSRLRLHWERYYCGAGLAATAHALSAGFGYVCVPASFSYRTPLPSGSTPLTDEMYSTPRLRIVHDGAERTRAEKVERIVAWRPDLVLRHLRVCLRNDGGPYNCGVCYKCVRTAVALAVVEAPGAAELFRNGSRSHWERTLAQDNLVLTEETLALARRRNADPALVGLLTRVADRHHRRAALHALLYHSPLDRLRPAARAVRDGVRRILGRGGGGSRTDG